MPERGRCWCPVYGECELSPLEGATAARLGPYPTGHRGLEEEVLVQESDCGDLCMFSPRAALLG